MVLMLLAFLLVIFFFFKQKTAYEMRISDWSSDVCSSDLEVEDRGPLARPCDTPVHQCGGDARSLGGFGDIELVELDGAVGRLAGGKLEIERPHLDIAEDRKSTRLNSSH